jgi:hypothetical protein
VNGEPLLLSSVALPGASAIAAGGLDQHILRISKLLLPLVAKPARLGPIPLFAFPETLDQFELTSARFSSTIARKAFHRWCTRPSVTLIADPATRQFSDRVA